MEVGGEVGECVDRCGVTANGWIMEPMALCCRCQALVADDMRQQLPVMLFAGPRNLKAFNVKTCFFVQQLESACMYMSHLIH